MEQCNKILSFINDEKLKEQINLQFSKYLSSTQRWEALTVVIANFFKRVKKKCITINYAIYIYFLIFIKIGAAKF